MSFTNIWTDDEPLATGSASLGYLDMQNIRIDVSERLAQALCGLSGNLPATLEAEFTTGTNTGMPYYATDQHKMYQLVAAGTYAEEACLGHWLIDVTQNSFTGISGAVVLNTVTIPSGFLANPPYLIEIEGFLEFSILGSFPEAILNFGGSNIIQFGLDTSATGFGCNVKASVYVVGANSVVASGVGFVASGFSIAAQTYVGFPAAGVVTTTGAVVVQLKASGTGSNVKGGWLTCKIRK